MRDIESVYRQIAQIAEEEQAERVVLFGSRARGEAAPKSDIDLAVWGCPDFPTLKDRLDNELWSLLELDVVNMNESTSSELLKEIERDGRLIYEEVR